MSFLNRSIHKIHWISRLLLFSLFSVNSSSLAALAESVWIDTDEQANSIYFASFNGDGWRELEKPLYVSENPLTSLALGTNSQGGKTLIWTEQTKVKTVLMFMVADLGPQANLTWSTPALFSDYGNENFSSSIVYDRSGQGWVFWSATNERYSDIFVRRSNGRSWGETQQVNSSNNVPDNQPIASINDKGDVRVEWNSFDLELNSYVLKSRDFEIVEVGTKNGSASTGEPTKLIDIVTKGDVPTISSASTNSSMVLHFPGNQVLQFVLPNIVN